MTWWERVIDEARAAQAAQAPQPTQRSDLEASAADRGYVLEFGGGYQNPNDPDVYMGRIQALGSPDSLERGGAQAPGDSLMPLSRANGIIYTWDQDELRAFQEKIVSAGIVSAEDIAFGARDVLTVRAWQQLVAQSAEAFVAGARISPDDLLGELVSSPIPRPGQEEAPFSGQVTNPLDIAAGLRAAFRERTGSGKIPEDEMERMISAFQSEQVKAQRANFDARKSGGTTVAAPDFATFAEQEAERVNPVGFRAHEYLDKFSAIESMLGGGSALSS